MIVVLPFEDHISSLYRWFIAISLVLIIQYFRVVTMERSVVWIHWFPVRLLFFFGNIALFIYGLHWFMYFIGQFEDYNFTGAGVRVPDIQPGLGANGYTALRNVTFFCGISGLILIVLFEMRMVYSIFKYRLIPGFRDER